MTLGQEFAAFAATTAVVTALTPVIGFERATSVAKAAPISGQNVWDILEAELHLTPEFLLQLRDPSTLTKPWKAQKLTIQQAQPRFKRRNRDPVNCAWASSPQPSANYRG